MKQLLNSLSQNRRLVSAQRRGVLRGADKIQGHFNYLRSIRSGSKISRFFRHIFEHKHIKRVLGSNLAFLMAFATLSTNSGQIPIGTAEQTIYSAPEANMVTEISIRYPLEGTQINQGYYFFHPGIDFEGDTGDFIYPIMEGQVEYVQYSKYDYGNAVLVDHQNGYKSLYAHMSRVRSAVGQEVDVFDIIGEVGSTGRSTGDHLHIEVYENGRAINPLSLLP